MDLKMKEILPYRRHPLCGKITESPNHPKGAALFDRLGHEFEATGNFERIVRKNDPDLKERRVATDFNFEKASLIVLAHDLKSLKTVTRQPFSLSEPIPKGLTNYMDFFGDEFTQTTTFAYNRV